MLKLNDKITIQVSVSGIKLTSKTMTVKALLVSLNILDEDWHLFLGENGLDSLQKDVLCLKLVDDSSISLKKEDKKTITHKEFNQFLDWVELKYPNFCFYGEAYEAESLNEIKEELEHEYSSDPHKEYSISDVVKCFKSIEYEQNNKFKTKSVKTLLSQWLKEMD